MAKKRIDTRLAEVKKLLTSKKLVIGKERTIKYLKQGKVKKVFMSSNCSKALRDDVARYASIDKVEVQEMGQNNKELGTVCKKPYAISILSVLKE